MPKEYFFVARHGKAWAPKNWSGVDYTRPLTRRGEEQSLRLAARIKEYEVEYPVRRVVTSSSKRCLQTARIIGDFLELDVRLDDRLSDDPAVLKLITGGPRELIKPGVLLVTHGAITEQLCGRRLAVGRHVRREIE